MAVLLELRLHRMHTQELPFQVGIAPRLHHQNRALGPVSLAYPYVRSNPASMRTSYVPKTPFSEIAHPLARVRSVRCRLINSG